MGLAASSAGGRSSDRRAAPQAMHETAAGGGDQHYGMEEWLSNRTAGQHLPISLATAGDKGKKKQSASTTADAEGDSAQQGRVRDDTFVDSREIVSGTGQLMLFQLPACSPAPDMGTTPVDTSAAGTGSTGLLEGSLAATVAAADGERVLDLDTFRTLQEQRQRDQQQAQQAHRWPVGAEGLLGRLRVHASGKTSLLVNGTVWQAMASSYRPGQLGGGGGQQRVVAIDADHQQSFDLGPLASHCVFTPSHL